MNEKTRPSRLRFNFGFLLEAPSGTSREIELNYPTIQIADDVILTPLQGKFNATRTSDGVYLNGTLTSVIKAQCVRCLEDAWVPISFELDETFYYPPHAVPSDKDDYYTFDGDTGFIDLSPLVRELSLLELPIKALCRSDCQGLCQECGFNLNNGDCGCKEDSIDPRLAVLRTYLEN